MPDSSVAGAAAVAPGDPVRSDTLLAIPAFSAVMRLFLPLMVASIVGSLIGIVDMYLAGTLDSAAQAAVGIGDQVIFLVITLGTGLTTACASTVSRAAGAGDERLACLYARDSLLVGGLLGTASTFAGVVAADPFLQLLHCGDTLSGQAAGYIQWCSLANLPYVLSMCQAAALRATGRAGAGTWIWVVNTAVSVIGSFLLFYGAPEPLGRSILALAVAWIVGACAGMVAGFVLLAKHMPDSIRLERREWSAIRLRTLIATAFPLVAGELAFVLSNFYRYAIISDLPAAAELQAAWTIRLKIEETLALIPLMALSYAVSVVCGHYLGAGRAAAARRVCALTAIGGGAIMLVIGTALALNAPLVTSLFTHDPASMQATVTLLLPAPLILPCCALWLIFASGLEAAGLTRSPGIINGVEAFVGRVALSALFIGPLALGIFGLSCASCVSSLGACLAAIFCFRRQFPQ